LLIIESFEDIDPKDLDKILELKSKIFMHLFGAEEKESLPPEEDTIKILNEKYGLKSS